MLRGREGAAADVVGKTLTARILTALDEQSVLIPGTAAFGRVITGAAATLRDNHLERDALAADLETRLEAHPLHPVLTSMPGIGLRTCLKILTIVGDGTAFPPPDTWPPTPACPEGCNFRAVAVTAVMGTWVVSRPSGRPGIFSWAPGFVTQNSHDRADPSGRPEPMDGDDPRARDCYADAVTEASTALLLPDGRQFGTLRLRRSARCGTEWGSAYYDNPKFYTIRITATRPTDGAKVVSEWSSNTPPGSYCDMLSTATGCVTVQAVVIVAQVVSTTASIPCRA